MKRLFMLSVMAVLSATAFGQTVTREPVKVILKQEAELSCGKCNFGMKGDECSLAVRIKGIAYPVESAKLDDYGDAHAADGMCKVIRKAEVEGRIVDGRFRPRSITLLPIVKKSN